MEIQRYNRLKIVLAEKERTGTWLSEQMGHSISTVSRWMTNKVQPSVEQRDGVYEGFVGGSWCTCKCYFP